MQSTSYRDSASVLVVDDEQGVGRLIRLNLENDNTRVIDVATGYDGMRFLREAKIDVLLMDMGLPDVDGKAVLREVRATDSLSNLPVIVISAEPPTPRLMEQFRLHDYIQKPFDIRRIVSQVGEAIRERDALMCRV